MTMILVTLATMRVMKMFPLITKKISVKLRSPRPPKLIKTKIYQAVKEVSVVKCHRKKLCKIHHFLAKEHLEQS